jgi:probable rRNA maturation factor
VLRRRPDHDPRSVATVSLQIDIQRACSTSTVADENIENWIAAALAHRQGDAEVCVRLVTEEEMSRLNHQYRGRDSSTNVLSFPADIPADLEHPLLGDIVICSAVVAREAAEQDKGEQQHWAHMLVHGCLHLLGYDHIDAADAEQMESLETTILQALGYPCPYTGKVALQQCGAQAK